MKNLALFVLTVAGWFGVWWYISGAPEGVGGYLFRLGILALLSAPWNIDGNIWTVLGNAESEGSIYSFFSVYQKAGRDASAVCGLLLYQKAGEGAYIGCGISIYQSAEEEAFLFLGISIWQKAFEALVVFGFLLVQKATDDAFLGLGIALYQGICYPGGVYGGAFIRTQTALGFTVYQTVPSEYDIHGRIIATCWRMPGFGAFPKR